MAAESRTQNRSAISLESAMAGVLALLIDEREERTRNGDAVRTEVLLSNAGLSIEEIANLTGKKYDTVRMSISRGKKARRG